MPQQIPLDLESADRYDREHFIANAALRDVLDVLLHPEAWLNPLVILLGPQGSGKTHLGHVFAEATGARFFEAAATYGLDVANLPATSFVVDDAEVASQETLFHLFNQVQRTSHHLVLLTKTQPIRWTVSLADLRSRLGAMRLISLPEPDEDLLGQILHKLFTQRAISPSPDSIDYIVSRMDRSVSAAQKIVTELEQYANGRPFNRSLARDFFEESGRLSFGGSDTESDDSF